MLHLIKPKRFYHPNPELHFNTRWRQSGDTVRVWYLIYQIIVCGFMLGNVIYDWIDTDSSTYFIFMTHWGIVMINIAVVIETVLTIYIFLKFSRADKPKPLLQRLLHISWCLSHASYSAAIFISILYWSFLYGGETTWLNFYVHGAQGIFSLVDQLISSRPWEGGHWWVCLPLPTIYLIFNLIYYAAGGTFHGNNYIYDILDWEGNPGFAAGISVAAIFILIGIHYFFVLLTFIRDWLHRKATRSAVFA